MTPPDAPRSQFEQRMRLRRAATCVSAARVAIDAGRLVEAEDRLEEACRLDPERLEARTLLDQLRTEAPRIAVPPVVAMAEPAATGISRWSHWIAILIAVVALAALAWWRVPAADESRFTPARQPEQRDQPQPEAPTVADKVPADPPAFPEATPSPEDLLATTFGEMPPATPEATVAGRLERGTTGRLPQTPSRSLPASAPATPSEFAASPAAPQVRPEPSGSERAELTRPEPSPLRVASSEATGTPPTPPQPAAAVPGLLEEAASRRPSTDSATEAAAAPPPPPPAPDAAPASMRNDAAAEEVAIGQVLEQYVDAYNRLDARAASRVWPTVDRRALARAFAGLESQGISFEGCDLSVEGAAATAACRGRARYVPKVGDRDPISQSRRWTFRLHRGAAGWQIVQAEAR